jgi:hypothetical protein
MVTSIGNTSFRNVISDNATIASGTYAWYLNCANGVKRIWPLSFLVKTINAFAKILGKKAYKTDMVWMLETTITSLTDWQNLQKAIGTWEKASTLLYLHIWNEWGSSNLFAVYPTYTTPTTLAQNTGHLSDYNEEILSNEVKIKIKFHQIHTKV